MLLALIPFLLILWILKTFGVLNSPSSHDLASLADQRGLITGVVVAHPDARPAGCVYQLAVETVETFEPERQSRAVQGRLLLHVSQSTSPIYSPGDRLRVYGRIQSPPPARTPGAFDYKSYLENHGVHSLMYTSQRQVTALGPSGLYPWKRMGWRAKSHVLKAFQFSLTAPAASVLAGLVVGERPRFHPDIRKIFLESGTMHVLVASGSNIAFVMALWVGLMRFLFRLPRRWALGSSLLAIIGYAALVGADPPIFRAAVMGVIGLLYYLQEREDRPYQPLALAAWTLLLISPQSLFDIGFQMSFLTVFGMVHMWAVLEFLWPNGPWWGRRLLQLALTTVTAQLWLLPLTASVFHQFYPISLLSNLLVIPLAMLGLPAGILLVLGDALGVMSFSPIVQAYLDIFIGLAKFFSEWPGTLILLAPFPWIATISFYSALFTGVWIKKSLAARCAFCVSVGVLVASFGFSNLLKEQPAIQLTWIDMGRSCGILIEQSTGPLTMIYPGGSPAVNERIVVPFLSEKGIRAVDLLVLPKQSDALDKNVKDLQETIAVKKVETSEVVCLRTPNVRILIGEMLPWRVQKEWAMTPSTAPFILQARLSRTKYWHPEFLKKCTPTLIVDPGFPNERRQIPEEWKDVPLVIPQKEGWWQIVIPDERSEIRDPVVAGNNHEN